MSSRVASGVRPSHVLTQKICLIHIWFGAQVLRRMPFLSQPLRFIWAWVPASPGGAGRSWMQFYVIPRTIIKTSNNGTKRIRKSLIDHFSTSNARYILKTDVLETGMVDHYLIYGIRKINAWRIKKPVIASVPVSRVQWSHIRRHRYEWRRYGSLRVARAALAAFPRPAQRPAAVLRQLEERCRLGARGGDGQEPRKRWHKVLGAISPSAFSCRGSRNLTVEQLSRSTFRVWVSVAPDILDIANPETGAGGNGPASHTENDIVCPPDRAIHYPSNAPSLKPQWPAGLAAFCKTGGAPNPARRR